MKLLLAFVAGACAVPLQPELFIEIERPTFAKGIPTACEYRAHTNQNLGHIFAEGHEMEYENERDAKAKCDEIGPNCGGLVETDGKFTLYAGRRLFVGHQGQITHLKGMCAFPLPSTDYPHTNNAEVRAEVQSMRWKLSNGPEFARLDDGRDHGTKSRLHDGKVDVFDVNDCIKSCAERSDCQSGHYCSVGEAGASGSCYLSGDWDPYGEDSAEGCQQAQNFKKTADWVKPVMRTESGDYVKEQWHTKETLDNAKALEKEAAAESIE